MATKKEKPATNWEDAAPEDMGQWESLSGAFAPLWKPETGNAIIVQPQEVTQFKTKKKGKVKGPSFAISCILKGGSTANFYSGKGNAAASVSLGDTIIVGSSYNVQGEDKLIVIEQNGKGKNSSTTARLSSMAELVKESNAAFRLVFNGQVKTSGPRRVNDITVQVPNGFKDKFRQKRS